MCGSIADVHFETAENRPGKEEEEEEEDRRNHRTKI